MQGNADTLALKYLTVKRFERAPAEQAGSVDLQLGVNFLNDALGRWERALDRWRLQVGAEALRA